MAVTIVPIPPGSKQISEKAVRAQSEEMRNAIMNQSDDLDTVIADLDTLETTVATHTTQIAALQPAAGDVVQIVTTTSTTRDSTTTLIPIDETIPQNTEGKEYMTRSITPTSATNRLNIEIDIPIVDASAGEFFVGALFQDTTADALATGLINISAATFLQQFTLKYSMIAGTTSSTTFKFRFGPGNSGAVTVYTLRGDGAGLDTLFGSSVQATMTITEIQV